MMESQGFIMSKNMNKNIKMLCLSQTLTVTNRILQLKSTFTIQQSQFKMSNKFHRNLPFFYQIANLLLQNISHTFHIFLLQNIKHIFHSHHINLLQHFKKNFQKKLMKPKEHFIESFQIQR